MKLKAEEIFLDPKDGGCATAGFKAVGDEYVLFNRDLEPTEQDVSLGHGVHLVPRRDPQISGLFGVASRS